MIWSIALSANKLKTRLSFHRRWLILALSLALTTLTLYFVFRGIDRGTFKRLITTQNPVLLVAAALLNGLQIGLGGVRWGTILSSMCKGTAPRLLNVQAVFYASIFFNYLPVGTVGGDVARVWLARRFPLSVREIVLSVLLDRILVVGALVILAAITLPSIAHPLAVRASIGCGVILLACVAGFLLLQPIERIAGRWRAVWLIASILRTAEELLHTTRRVGLRAGTRRYAGKRFAYRGDALFTHLVVVQTALARGAHRERGAGPNGSRVPLLHGLQDRDAPSVHAAKNRPIERRWAAVAGRPRMHDETETPPPNRCRDCALQEWRENHIRCEQIQRFAGDSIVYIKLDRELVAVAGQLDIEALR